MNDKNEINFRPLRNGETLSGHGGSEIIVYDGKGARNGSMVFTIQSFRSAQVEIEDGTTYLYFGPTTVTVTDGVVEYAERKLKKRAG